MALLAFFCGVVAFIKPYSIHSVMSGFMLWTVLSTSLCKYLTVIFYRNEISEIIQFLPKYCNNDQKYVKMFIKFHHFFFGFLYFLLISSILTVIQHLLHHRYDFSLVIWFPFDAKQPMIYPFVLAWEMLANWTCYMANALVDFLFYEIIFITSIEFLILKKDFRELKVKKLKKEVKTITKKIDAPSTSYPNLLSKLPPKMSEKEEKKIIITKKVLQKLIERHQKLLETRKLINKIVQLPFSLTFFMISVVLCSIVFRMTIEYSYLLQLIIGLIINIIKISMQCTFGQMIIDSSNELVDGIYDCGWEEFEDIQMKQLILMAMMRMREPEKFETYGNFEISIEEFGKIMEATYSYFTLCRNVFN
ncbi:hypothetical protein PVAND_017563 [Polypedilum vanderplanki]|uniref:Odorant receptor n=1 Tax=Polypedilum vanderplanki TaxID=319348 RepID=A0A9J6BJ16_POLVA|nr:hypothetical protein PVAND_017563 [Polypedilum vanderplanki]